jgi:acyl-CoA oxidase
LQIHSTGYIYRNFRSAIAELAKTEDPSNGVVDILTKICELYGAWSIDQNAAFFLKYHYYSPTQMDIISAKVADLCAEIRKCTMSIVDAFCFTDHLINSPLGRADGDVYKAYFELVRARNPPGSGRPSYFESLIKPLLERESPDLSDGDSSELDEEIAEIIEERKNNSKASKKKGLGEEEPKRSKKIDG